jgi:hypothetical protein
MGIEEKGSLKFNFGQEKFEYAKANDTGTSVAGILPKGLYL